MIQMSRYNFRLFKKYAIIVFMYCINALILEQRQGSCNIGIMSTGNLQIIRWLPTEY